MSESINRFNQVNQRIRKAIDNAHRDDPVKLLAVSKRHSENKIRQLYALGQRDFGESYLQEAASKISATSDLDINWHFIGPVQSNKSRDIAVLFNWVHSVDRLKIARRLSNQRPPCLPPLNICLQVNISNEAQKSGFSTDELLAQFETIATLPNLSVRGLMTIPKATDDYQQQCHAFRQLRELLEIINHKYHYTMDTLSMGMSADLEAAIHEGATIVRIGTDLFGARKS